jgi:cytochrome P450
MIFANAWAIGHDESEYENPDVFIPERFLNNKYGTRNLSDKARNEGRRITYGFGAGRRICPGQKLAENSLVRVPACLYYTSV